MSLSSPAELIEHLTKSQTTISSSQVCALEHRPFISMPADMLPPSAPVYNLSLSPWLDHVSTHKYTDTHTNTHTYTHKNTHRHAHTGIYVHMKSHSLTQLCVCVCVCVIEGCYICSKNKKSVGGIESCIPAVIITSQVTETDSETDTRAEHTNTQSSLSVLSGVIMNST